MLLTQYYILKFGDSVAMSEFDETGWNELRNARRAGRALLIWAFVFSIFVNLLMLTGPLYMLQIYDHVLVTRSVSILIELTILVAALYAFMAVLDYARGRVLARMAAGFQSRLDERVFEASLRPTSDKKGAAASSMALRDLDGIHSFFSSPILMALMDMPWTPIFIAAIFLLHPMLGWLAVGGGALIVLMAYLNHSVTARRTRIAHRTNQNAHAFADMTRAGREVVLTQGFRPAMIQRWVQHRQEALAKGIEANDWTGSFTSTIKAFRLFLQSAMLGLGAYLFLQGALSAGAMIVGSILLARALAPVEQGISQWPVLQRARASWVSLGDYLTELPVPAPKTDLPQPVATLQVDGLTVMPPGSEKAVLHDVSFRLEPGQALGVIGPSGAGKSTLARALLGYWPVADGDIRIGGLPVQQYDPDRLGTYIGYLPQHVKLFAGTLTENVARMSLKPDVRAVLAATAKARAHEIISNLPQGYDTVLNGAETQLSGGQRQRIALARAFFGDPMLLVLDEPNSALDADGSSALNEAVRQFKADGKAVIIMTHRKQAIEECDLLMIIEGGRIIKFGPRDEVIKTRIQEAGRFRAV